MNHTEQSSAGNFQTEKDRHRVGKAQALSLPLKLPPVSAGAPQILKGCATPEVCHLQANTTLGPEASGFHLTTKPECNYVAPTTHPGALNPDFLRPYPFCPLWIDLASALTKNQSLTHLYLSGNSLGSEGMNLLCRAVKLPNCGLQRLM